MATRLEKLFFAIGLRDDASGKLRSLQRSIDATCRQVRNNFEGIKAGALSAAGSGMAMYQMVNPAIDFNRAVGEVASLDVAEAALAHLQGQAKLFAMQYGGNAAEVVRASYDIQSAIAGLEGKELGTFTVASATLARATKADAGTITSYMGTMYGIFKQQADGMGKAQWVEQLTGRTALAVQIFKTTGAEMASAFTALGANATAAGIAAQEQMAVLGMLQSTMSGSEAGTKYKAFLAGIGGAQKELGLKFTDKNGNMLGMEAILGKIKGKFGETFDVNESDQLKKAFGSDEAVSLIKLLMADTKGLSANIDALGQVKGMAKARDMAGKMTDVWGRLGASFNVVAITFGQKVMPSIEKLVGRLTGFLGYLQRCMDIAPGLTRWLGILALGALALGGVMGLLGMVVAVNKMAFLGLSTGLKPLVGLLKLLTLGNLKLAAAMLANPLTWVVMAVLLLTVAVAGLILYWDQFKAAFGDTWWGAAIINAVQGVCEWWQRLTAAFSDNRWGDALLELLNALLKPLSLLGDGIAWVWNALGFGGPDLGNMGGLAPDPFAPNPLTPDVYTPPMGLSPFTGGPESVPPTTGFQGRLSPVAAQAVDPALARAMGLTVLPGVSPVQPPSLDTAPRRVVGLSAAPVMAQPSSLWSESPPRIAPTEIAALEAPRTQILQPGGVTTHVAETLNRQTSHQNNRSTQIHGGVNIYPQTMLTPEQLEEQLMSY